MVGKVIAPSTQAPVGDVTDVAAAERVKRQPIHQDAGIKLPVQPDPPVQDTPLAQSLVGQGFDIEPLPRTESQAAADADAEAGLAPGTGAPAFVEGAEEQRRAERVKPLSQRAVIQNNPDKAQAALDRATNVVQYFQDDVSTTPKKAAFGEGDFAAAGYDSDTSPSRLIFDPNAFDAGELTQDFKSDRVNPVFGAVAGLVTENFFRNPSSNYLTPEIDFQDQVEASPEVDPETAAREISSAKDNAKLGSQIWEEWMREKAQLDGLESDQYIIERRKPDNKQLAAMGGLAKHAYARANPDLIEVVPGGKNRGDQRHYQITQEGVDSLEESYAALSKPFESAEIPPLNAPSQSGQPAYEAKTRAKKQTTATGVKDAGKQIEDAKVAYHNMKRMENANREKIFYSQLTPAILDSLPIVYQATQKDAHGALTFDIAALNDAPDHLFADAYKVGANRAAGLAQQKINQIAALEQDIAAEDNPDRRKQLEKELENTKKLEPAKMYKAEVLKALETMNSSARYSNQILHSTFSTQMLTGRIGIQQNKWNPQNNTMLRFVSGSPNIVGLTPGRKGGAEANFKEAMAAHFVKGGTDLKPNQRAEAFEAWKNGRDFRIGDQAFDGKVTWDEAVKAGQDIKQALANTDVQGMREALAAIQGGSQVALQESAAPLQQVQGAQISPTSIATISKIAGKKRGEAPYITDWLQAIADWDAGKPFSTSIEVEVDGITHGMSSNAMALGIEQMATRSGVINPHPDLKLTPADIEFDITEADINHFVERENQRARPSSGPEGHSAELVEYRLAKEGKALPPNDTGAFSWTDYRDKDGTRVDIKMLDPGKKDVWFRDSVQKAKANGTHDVDVYEFWERVVWPKGPDGKNRPLQAGDKVVVRPLGRVRTEDAFAQSETKPFSKGALVYTAQNLEPTPHSDVQGDVRDNMKAVMQKEARQMAKTMISSADEAGVSKLVELAGLAIQDRENYLKKSPMTLGYGQEVQSLKMHVKTTINASPDINTIINDPSNDVDLNGAVDYLHALLVESLNQSLDPRVLEVADQLRVNNVLATLTDIPIQYTNASGFTSSITKAWDVPDSVEYATFKEQGKDIATPIYTEKYASGSTPRTYQEGGKAIPGGFGHGRVVPTVAQTYDANMMSGIVTGQTGKRLEDGVKGRGYDYSFLPVFDAAKVDLAHLDLVREAMNREWWEGIKRTDYVGEIMGPGGWYDQTLRDFRQKIADLPQHTKVAISPNNEWRGMFYYINDFKHVKKMFEKYHPNGEGDAEFTGFEETKAFFSALRSGGIKAPFPGDPEVTELTPYQMNLLVDEMMEQLKVKQRNQKIASDVKRAREQLFKKVRERDILQVDL